MNKEEKEKEKELKEKFIEKAIKSGFTKRQAKFLYMICFDL